MFAAFFLGGCEKNDNTNAQIAGGSDANSVENSVDAAKTLNAKSDDNSDNKSDDKIDENSDNKSDDKSDNKSNDKIDENSDTESDAKSDDNSDNKSDDKIDAKTNNKNDRTSVDNAIDPALMILSSEDKAKNMLANMTLEQKVGQMFIGRCYADEALDDIDTYQLGGYILFKADFYGQTKESINAKLQSYQNQSKIPILIGIDEEGGRVVRASSNYNLRDEAYASAGDIFVEGGADALKEDSDDKCEFLKNLGVNMNFAPVCDVPESASDFIYQRAISTDSSECAKGVAAIVESMNDKRVISVLKHFPGYGNNVDTHKGFSYDKRDFDNFVNRDFAPFEAGIDAGAPCVLVSHNIVECMDENAPASLSLKVHDVLRKDLHFKGVIVTDDLSMDAITGFAGTSEAAVLAVKAGNDLLCVSDYKTQVPAVIDAVNAGEITQQRIDESVIRILTMKYKYGIAK